MRLKFDFEHFIKRWFFFVALLAVTFWFPSVRESQTICFRWLLHLNGKTFVQGLNKDSDYMGFIPSVEFTAKCKQAIRCRSTNSLENFALATIACGWSNQPPRLDAGWTSNPLLPWATFYLTWMPIGGAATNTISLETLNGILPVIRLAQARAPTNGGFWQAEALADFAAQADEAAIKALWISSSNASWNASLSETYFNFKGLLERAGYSEFEAAQTAMQQFPPAYFVQRRNEAALERIMIKSVNDRKPEEFLKLLQLIVELRRQNWSDENPANYNCFRGFIGSQDLIQSMAAQLQINLATNWTDLEYKQRNLIRQQVFQVFLSRFADQVTITRFNSQAESFQTEKHLRDQVKYGNYRSERWSILGALLCGALSLLMITLTSAALMFELIVRYLSNKTGPAGKWPLERKFLVLSLFVVILSSMFSASFLQAFGVGLPRASGEPPPLINLYWGAYIIPFILFSTVVVQLAEDWKRGKFKIKPWDLTRLLVHFYLACVILMAFFRYQYVAEISAQYQ